ncbi:MAG: KGG domain-containing protein [Pseudomonadota bacterium]
MATKNSDDNDGRSSSGKRDNQGQGGQGFASMDPERQREIASEGGRAAHESGNAHEFTSEEAREAGKKSHGGQGGSSSDSGKSSQGGRGS